MYDLLEPHIDNPAQVIAALAVFHLLDVVDAFAPEFKLPDLVEVPRTALEALIEELEPMEPRMREWIFDWMTPEFTYMPEMNDHIERLHGCEVVHYDYDFNYVHRLT